ncbi:MAG: PepSY domain-containing protein [Bacteroidales bacterium]|nr:PepSY domain-containing protein [Bacteroidales bacterium]
MSKKTYNKPQWVKLYRKHHRWPGLIMSFIILFFSFSGLIMNHREYFSETEINRKHLPKDYQYQNWNLSAVKGSLNLSNQTSLIYGNIGIWQSSDNFLSYMDFNHGLPDGIDNRKIYDLLETKNGKLFAATFSGLYIYKRSQWLTIELPEADKRVVSLAESNGQVYIMTRSNIYTIQSDDKEINVKKLNIPINANQNNKVSLFKTLWLIHSGEIFGLPGKLFTDVMAVVFIIISITGIIYFLIPFVRKRKKKLMKSTNKLNKFNRITLKWHNKLGYYSIVILIIITLTGMFLRPPLLIAIAETKVSPIPFTHLSNKNPWFDKFRMIAFDEETATFIISTLEGMYFSDDYFANPLKKFNSQPPISIMGINVFEKISHQEYLIGSFSGLFLWNPEQNYIEDFIEQKPYRHTTGKPVGQHIITGFIVDKNNDAFVFDYNMGVKSLSRNTAFPAMSDNILHDSPMSVWNLCLEIHTGRIFKNIIGDFYILFVPLSGIFLLLVLGSGLLLYLKSK